METVKVDSTPQACPAKKGIGLVDGVIFVLSCTIGSGLFFAPSQSAMAVKDPWVSLAAWAVAGILSLAGSLVYSELGTSLVSAGAESLYLQKAFGSMMSFTFSWTMVTIIGPSACACISWVLSDYLLSIFGIISKEHVTIHLFVAIGVMFFLCAVNLVNPNYVMMLNRFNVICKVLAVLVVVISGLVAISAGIQKEPFLTHSSTSGAKWMGFGDAVMFACFALSGWNMLNPLIEEMRNPGKDVPKIYSLGMISTMILALLVNAAFYAGLPNHVLVPEGAPESLAKPLAEALFSPGSARDAFRVILCVLISFCCLGSCNGIMMGTSKCMAANGREGVLPATFGVTSKKHEVPYISVIFFTAWTVLLLFVLSCNPEAALEFVVKMYTVGQWGFFCLVGISLFALRFYYPNLERPYKIHFYPVFPAFFSIAAAFVVVMTFCCEMWYAGVSSLAIILVGTALYYASKVDACRRIYFKIAALVPDLGQPKTEKTVPVEG